MTWFLQSTNFYLWDIIENGPNIPTKVENVVFVPKPRKELDELDKRKNQLNAEVVYFLYYCGPSPNPRAGATRFLK